MESWPLMMATRDSSGPTRIPKFTIPSPGMSHGEYFFTLKTTMWSCERESSASAEWKVRVTIEVSRLVKIWENLTFKVSENILV